MDPINHDRLVRYFLDLVAINSPSKAEAPGMEYVRQALHTLGLTTSTDAAGNLYAVVAGSGASQHQEPLMLNAHVDTVQPAPNIQTRVEDGILRTDGTTILGADDKAGIAAILEVIAALGETGTAHPPLDIVITVEEEVGLNGARAVDLARVRARRGLTLDADGRPTDIVVAAPGQNSFAIEFYGQSAHAGVAPEQGRSAILAASRAIAAMPLGRIDPETTANVGTITGGQATNIIPDRCSLIAEARSRDAAKLAAQTDAMERAIRHGAESTGCRVTIHRTERYSAFQHGPETPIVQRCMQGIRARGQEPALTATGGGSDANVFNKLGIETVLLGVGYKAIHSPQEHIALSDVADLAANVYSIVTIGA